MKICKPSYQLPDGHKYRRATFKDEEWTKDVVYAVLEEFGLEPDPEGLDADLEDIDYHYRDGFLGVVMCHHRIIGTYGIVPVDAKTVEIRKVYVLPRHRKMGVGRWMMDHLLDIARYNGYDRVVLSTAANLTRAIEMYHSYGFREETSDSCNVRCAKKFVLDL